MKLTLTYAKNEHINPPLDSMVLFYVSKCYNFDTGMTLGYFFRNYFLDHHYST